MSLKTVLALTAPGALLLGITAVTLAAAPDHPVLLQAARVYPFVALGAALLLGWRIQRSRLVAAALLLMILHTLLQPGALGNIVPAAIVCITLVPCCLAMLSLTRDARIFSRRAAAQLAIVTVPLALLGSAATVWPVESTALLLHDFFDPIYTSWTQLPQTALLLAIPAFVTVAAVAARRAQPGDAGLGWVLLATLAALTAQPGSAARGIWFLCGGVLLVIAVVETSYVMAYHDELTGLPARRALNELLAALRAPYAIAVVDIDHFKQFNDRHGHDVGDQVLRMVAGRLARVSGGGRAFRSGGEEFTLVFPGLTRAAALPHMEAVRDAVEQASFALRSTSRPHGTAAGSTRRGSGTAARRLSVTISAGLAASGGRHDSVTAVVKTADRAMYRAKRNGRNRVVV